MKASRDFPTSKGKIHKIKNRRIAQGSSHKPRTHICTQCRYGLQCEVLTETDLNIKHSKKNGTIYYYCKLCHSFYFQDYLGIHPVNCRLAWYLQSRYNDTHQALRCSTSTSKSSAVSSVPKEDIDRQIEVAKLKKVFHQIIDPIWNSGMATRAEIYRKVSHKVGFDCHAGDFLTPEQATKACRAAMRVREELLFIAKDQKKF